MPGTHPDGPGPAAPTRLVLIRHAESFANTAGVWVGHDTCRGLTARGRTQAAALRERLLDAGGIPAAALVTSRLDRAAETATIIGPAIAGGRHDPVRRCDLCELHRGALEGQASSAGSGAGTIYAPVADGGESRLAFLLRCRRALLDLARRFAGDTVVIVTHAGVIRAAMHHFAGISHSRSVQLEVSYTGITVWSTTASGWQLETFNDHAHLAATVDGAATVRRPPGATRRAGA